MRQKRQNKRKHILGLSILLFLLCVGCGKQPDNLSYQTYIDSAKEQADKKETPNQPTENKAVNDGTETTDAIVVPEADTYETEEVVSATEEIASSSDAEPREDTPRETTRANGCEIHFLDVGQGDCTLLLCDGEAMLIDAAIADKGTYIQNYLKKQGVTSLRYFIASHPDADHIGSAPVVLTKFPIETMFMPNLSSDTKTYERMVEAIQHARLKPINPSIGKTYSLGSGSFTILNPGDRAYEAGDKNDYSIAILFTYNNHRVLLTADCEIPAEEAMVEAFGKDLKADLYKAGHHGSSTSADTTFLQMVAPSDTVISCGENNDYGHPHAKTLNTLRSLNSRIYRTDEQGTIIADLSGDTITFNTAPSESWKQGEGNVVQEEKTEKDYANQYVNTYDDLGYLTAGKQGFLEEYYILNTNSKKIHRPSCPSVHDMAEHNKELSYETVDTLTENGYTTCGVCKP